MYIHTHTRICVLTNDALTRKVTILLCSIHLTFDPTLFLSRITGTCLNTYENNYERNIPSTVIFRTEGDCHSFASTIDQKKAGEV